MQKQLEAYRQMVEQHLNVCCDRYLPLSLSYPGDGHICKVNEAARYSLLQGGKRIRGVLVLVACELLGGKAQDALDFSAAVEMLHAYSLIHDDLPCMDDDDLRRGKPSCHKAYGEAVALLAGDALQTTAFECIAGACGEDGKPLNAGDIAGAVRALASGAGARGMVLGQELDLTYEAQPADEDTLKIIHRYKTGKLINAAVQMGLAAAGGTPEDAQALSQFAYSIGLAFQIQDDVLDATSTEEELGKPIGSDEENGKTTYVTLLGAQRCMAMAEEITRNACGEIKEKYGKKSDFLVWFAENLLSRKK